MKISYSAQKTEIGEVMRRSLSFLLTRMNFRTNGQLDLQVSSKKDLPDRLALDIDGVNVNFIVADDVSGCPGMVLVGSSVSGDQILLMFALNSILLTLHHACFSWCEETQNLLLARRIPEALVYDEDDLFDFAVDTVRLLSRCENMSILNTENESDLSVHEAKGPVVSYPLIG